MPTCHRKEVIEVIDILFNKLPTKTVILLATDTITNSECASFNVPLTITNNTASTKETNTEWLWEPPTKNYD